MLVSFQFQSPKFLSTIVFPPQALDARRIPKFFPFSIMPEDCHNGLSDGVDVSLPNLKRKSHGSTDNKNKKIKPIKSKSKGVSLKGDAIPLGKFLASNGRSTYIHPVIGDSLHILRGYDVL